MDPITTRLAAAAAAAGLALLAVGCSGTATTATGTKNSPAGATSLALPSPFTITAGYSAASLRLSHPDALAIGPDGNLYVTDLSQRVSVISPAGRVLWRWGKPGTGPGAFNFIPFEASAPTDVWGKIAIGADGTVYVSDSGNGRVQMFTPRGRFVHQLGRYGTGKGQFLRPFDLVVDQAGNVYVVDGQPGTLTKLSPTGNVIWQIGGSGSADPDLNNSFNVASIDVHGRLVVLNNHGKVLYIDSSGHKVDAFSPDPSFFYQGNICEVTVDAAGSTYLSGCGPDAPAPTLVYNRAHRLIARWPGTTYKLLRSPVFGPHGEVFALATDGTILKLRITLPGA